MSATDGQASRNGRRADAQVALSARHVVKHYEVRDAGRRRATLQAVDDVSLEVHAGETLGIVGESGCGKSTLGRILAGLEKPTSGTVEVADHAQAAVGRQRVQMVFQEPLGSLNPRMRVGDAVAEGIVLNGLAKRGEVDARVRELFAWVGLASEHAQRYPHELSGGQQQRVGVARALACEPSVIVEDEPTSALDVSVQAKLINLLRRLQRENRLTQVFISHDLAVVGYLADRVAVMYLGRVVELASTAQLFSNPRHPYTAALLSAAPDDDLLGQQARIVLPGDVPSPIEPPSGCPFHTRCAFARDRCRAERQTLQPAEDGHVVACWRAAAGEIDMSALASARANEDAMEELS